MSLLKTHNYCYLSFIIAPNATLEGLPDNIILSIMTLLDLRSLVLVSRVCRRFHHLYLDESIWISVDLTRDSVGSKIDSRILKNIIRTHLPTSLREIKLSSNAPSHASKNPVITVSLLDLLFAKCPRIERLTLEKCDLTTVRQCFLSNSVFSPMYYVY